MKGTGRDGREVNGKDVGCRLLRDGDEKGTESVREGKGGRKGQGGKRKKGE